MATAKQLAKVMLNKIAMDIGRETFAYIQVMYPKAVKAESSTFYISVRNHIYNEIMAAIQIGENGELIPQFLTTNEKGEVVNRITERESFRRKWLAQYRKIRESDGKRD